MTHEVPTHIYYEQTSPSEYDRSVPSPGVQEAIGRNQHNAYESLQASVGVETQTLPLADIASYFDRLGLTPPPIVVINTNAESLTQVAKFDPAAARNLRDPDTSGYYANSIHVAIVAEDKAGTVDRKVSKAVHESAHGTSMNAYRVEPTSESGFQYSPSRGGYQVESSDRKTTYNNVLEEGRPEMLAGHFVDQEFPSIKDAEPAYVNGIWIPAAYISSDRTVCSKAAPAAMALEMLIMKNPELLDVIVKGPTTVEGLRATVRELHSMEPRGQRPQLYEELRKASNDFDGYAGVAKSIIDKFYDGDQNAPIVAHAYVGQLMQDRYNLS